MHFRAVLKQDCEGSLLEDRYVMNLWENLTMAATVNDCNMYYLEAHAECVILATKSGLLRGNAKKLSLQIQLMLAVASAQFQVAECPIIAEVKRKLATRRCPCCQQAMRFMGVVKRTTNLIPAT
jgi:hypothetical protein